MAVNATIAGRSNIVVLRHKCCPLSQSTPQAVGNNVRRELLSLSKRSGETIQICARDEGLMGVIALDEGEGHFRVTSDVGTRVPLNWTTSGRPLLGHLPDADANHLSHGFGNDPRRIDRRRKVGESQQ